jgi:hypothetical protein
MSHRAQVVVAIVAAGAVLYLAGWFDGTVMRDIQNDAGRTFNPNELEVALSLGFLAVAGSMLLLATLARRSNSALVGAIYSTVGVLVAFLPVIVWQFAAEINNKPPVLPQPIADEVGRIYFWSTGPLNAMEMIGAGMLVVGILVIGRSLRVRPATPVDETPADPDALPAQP